MTNTVGPEDRPTLTLGERNALRRFCRSKRGFEAPSRWGRIGVASLRSLVEKGLAIEGPRGVFGPTFGLTEAGWTMLDRLENPRRKRPSRTRGDAWAKAPQRVTVTIDMAAMQNHSRVAMLFPLEEIFPHAPSAATTVRRPEQDEVERDDAGSLAET